MGSLPVIKPTMVNGEVEQFTLRIKGERFFCRCGCNVFHQPDHSDDNRYRCNLCKSEYETSD